MTRRAPWSALLAGILIVGGSAAAPPVNSPAPTGALTAGAPEIPVHALREWLYFNNLGWRYLEAGSYPQAERNFQAAVKAVWPYRIRHPRLLARTYLDLARVLYHEGRAADAEPLAKWVLEVRETHPTTKVDSLFQSVYTLGLITRFNAIIPSPKNS